jgi:hypothetical protein
MWENMRRTTAPGCPLRPLVNADGRNSGNTTRALRARSLARAKRGEKEETR